MHKDAILKRPAVLPHLLCSWHRHQPIPRLPPVATNPWNLRETNLGDMLNTTTTRGSIPWCWLWLKSCTIDRQLVSHEMLFGKWFWHPPPIWDSLMIPLQYGLWRWNSQVTQTDWLPDWLYNPTNYSTSHPPTWLPIYLPNTKPIQSNPNLKAVGIHGLVQSISGTTGQIP